MAEICIHLSNTTTRLLYGHDIDLAMRHGNSGEPYSYTKFDFIRVCCSGWCFEQRSQKECGSGLLTLSSTNRQCIGTSAVCHSQSSCAFYLKPAVWTSKSCPVHRPQASGTPYLLHRMLSAVLDNAAGGRWEQKSPVTGVLQKRLP